MTPGARVAAAIAILDQIARGTPAEAALTRWARASRFAGSGDRAAVRDHVFDALRHWRSDAARGGGASGRARMIGRLRGQGADLEALFSGTGHAPAPLSAAERAAGRPPHPGAEAADLPDWLVPLFSASLGAGWPETARTLQERAPISLRVNTRKTGPDGARARLAEDGVTALPNPRALTALTVTDGARRVRQSAAYRDGWVELQDAASQAATARITGAGRLLDFCAGGGGKALALDAAGWQVSAHDADPSRMKDLPARAQRGGHDITVLQEVRGQFDAVLVDVPCSGSGTWRRTPEAKWRLTQADLEALLTTQADILDQAAAHVAPGGALYYATCSVLHCENRTQIDAFLSRAPNWTCPEDQIWPVDAQGDGFYLARLVGDAG